MSGIREKKDYKKKNKIIKGRLKIKIRDKR